MANKNELVDFLARLAEICSEKNGLLPVMHYGLKVSVEIMGRETTPTLIMYVNQDAKGCLVRNPFNRNRTIQVEVTEEIARMIVVAISTEKTKEGHK